MSTSPSKSDFLRVCLGILEMLNNSIRTLNSRLHCLIESIKSSLAYFYNLGMYGLHAHRSNPLHRRLGGFKRLEITNEGRLVNVVWISKL